MGKKGRIASYYLGGPPEIPSPSTGSRIIVESVYSVLEFFFILGRFKA